MHNEQNNNRHVRGWRAVLCVAVLTPALICLPDSTHSKNTKLNVVATTTDLAYLARQVGGKNVSVMSLIRGSDDPHYVDARPDYILRVSKADVFIETGLDMEAGWTPVIIRQSRNRKVFKNGPGYCDASRNVHVLEVPRSGADRSKGDFHAFGNPHYLLDPVNALIAARNIRDTFLRVDPRRSVAYKRNFRSLSLRLQHLTRSEYKKFARFRGARVAVYHKEFSYLAHRFRFHIAVSIEEKPGVPPSASHLRKVIETIRREKIRAILIAPWNNRRYAQAVARRTGARVLIMPTAVGSMPGVRTYEGSIRTILARLRAALK